MSHIIINGKDSIRQIESILKKLSSKKYLLVCDSSFQYLPIKDYFNDLSIPHISFDKFTPNPQYEDVRKGVDLFNYEKCDIIIAVGGGSTIDVAKCIKLYCRMDRSINYLRQEYKDSGIPLIAIPTTAGTGSESTHYAVIYYEGNKQSITHDSIIPDFAILEPSVLKTLPIYQKKCTLLDALCQGIESWWSVNSNEESKEYSRIAVETIMKYMDSYIFDNDNAAAKEIMTASNYAGRAIDITQTTAAHAMSYKLTSMYKLPHGHAVAVCLPYVWKYMIDNPDKCIDPRGESYLRSIFKKIGSSIGADTPESAIIIFNNILKKLQISNPRTDDICDVDILGASVNPIRLKNNPVYLDGIVLNTIYKEILTIRLEDYM